MSEKSSWISSQSSSWNYWLLIEGGLVLWSMGINGGFGLQQCVGQGHKGSFVSSVPTVCYGIIFTGTVFFWLCPTHLHPPFSAGSTLWSGELSGDTHTNKQSDHTHTHTGPCCAGGQTFPESKDFRFAFAKYLIPICLVSFLMFCTAHFIPEMWNFSRYAKSQTVFALLCVLCWCWLHWCYNCHKFAHPVI